MPLHAQLKAIHGDIWSIDVNQLVFMQACISGQTALLLPHMYCQLRRVSASISYRACMLTHVSAVRAWWCQHTLSPLASSGGTVIRLPSVSTSLPMQLCSASPRAHASAIP